jgi:DNA mismatch repair protein MutL
LTHFNPIQLLPHELIDQIKAGEIIERPANIIKELIENSIDANASEINIEIGNNGLDFIQISDNGVGISEDQLPLAFERHATSKLKNFDDLLTLPTHGFRGEALASIASVAKIHCQSVCQDNSQLLQEITLVPGQKSILEKTLGHFKAGTSLHINQLFFNTPVRLKFLKTSTQEKNYIHKILTFFVLTYPHIRFSVKLNEQDKKVYEIVKTVLPSEIFPITRFSMVFKSLNFFTFEKEYEGYRLKGYVLPNEKISKRNEQWLVINNRFIDDPALGRTIHYSLKSLWPYAHGFQYYLQLSMPQNHLDINVHPNKIIVKFINLSLVTSLISSSLKSLEKTIHHQTDYQDNEVKNLPNTSHSRLNETNDHYFKNYGNHHLVSTNSENESQPNHPFMDHLVTSKNESNSDLIHLSPHYALWKNQNHFYLINYNQFLLRLVERDFQDEKILSEDKRIPLLISLPFTSSTFLPTIVQLHELASLGFEIEQIDHQGKFLLKVMPILFLSFDVISLVQKFLESNSEITLSNWFEFLRKIYLTDYLHSNDWMQFYHQHTSSFGNFNSFGMQLKEEHWKKIFINDSTTSPSTYS